MNDFAGRLRSVRRHLQLSSSDMATSVGLKNRKSWEGYEKGLNSPKVDVVCKLAEIGISPRWLLTGEGEIGDEKSGLPLSSAEESLADEAAIDIAVLRDILEQAHEANRREALFGSAAEMARGVALGYAMIMTEKKKGNAVSAEALHFLLRAASGDS